MNTTIAEQKNCRLCKREFYIYKEDIDFYNFISPVFSQETLSLPTPSLCPDCRQKRRLVWRNDRNLYKRKCDATGKEIISIFSPDKPFRVYDSEFYWSDTWDIEMSEREFDFSRSFFSQFSDLYISVPKRALLK